MATKAPESAIGKQRSPLYFTWQRLKKNRGAVLGLCFLCFLAVLLIFADFLFDYNDVVIKMNTPERLQWPSAAHWFGTDESGRDVLARVIHGGRRSVLIAAAAVTIGTVIGGTCGAISGFYKSKFSELLMRLMDILLAIPATLFALVIVAVLGSTTINLVIACAVPVIPKMSRILSSSVITCGSADYVEAARARGAKESFILIKHILPNSIAPLFVQYTINIGTTIILLSGMSFLGLGIQAPTPEWGSMLSSARTYIRDYSYLCMFPGLAIMLTILSLNLLGDGLRDALDPRLK